MSGPAPQPLCASADLAERGRAHGFTVPGPDGQPLPAFVLRVDGELRAWLNRCAHQPAEMDWTPGEFWDAERHALVCALHGAHYDPRDGRCLGGPCGRGRLIPVAVHEQAGQVFCSPPAWGRAARPDNPTP